MVGKRAGRALAGGGPGGLESGPTPASTAGPAAVAASRGPDPLQADGPDARGGPAADGLDGSACTPAYSNGATSAGALSGPAGVAGLAGAGVADAAPAGADAADDGGLGHLLPVANAAAVVVEPSPGAANFSAIDITTGVEPVGCLCSEPRARPHPGLNTAWTKGGYGGRGAPSATAGARSTFYTATNVT